MISALVLALWVGTAPAQAPAAMVRFQEGMAHLQAGRCAEALVAFEEVARARPTPGVLRKVAECRTKLAQWPAAREAWRRYLAEETISDREAAAKELAAAEAAMAQAEPRAEEPKPPQATLDHNPLRAVPEGNSPVLLARVSPAGKAVPQLKARFEGLKGFATFSFEAIKGSSDLYSVQLPPAGSAFEYYVELPDDAGRPIVALGSSAQPFHVEVPSTAPVRMPEPVATQSTSPNSGAGRSWGVALGVAGGAALAIGGAATLISQDTIRRYNSGNESGSYQEVHRDEALAAVGESRLGVALLGVGLLSVGVGFALAF